MPEASKKILIFTLIISLLAGNFSYIFTKKSFAAVAPQPVIETNVKTIAADIKTAISTGITAGTVKFKNTFDFAQFAKKIAGQVFKKVILDRLVDALVAYISGQSNTIIGDWDEFFDQAADLAVGEVAQQLGAGFLCSNFDLNLRLTLLPVKQFSKGTTCSLTSIISNIDSFIENFENGGWIGYQEQWYPQNNFYGATLTALDEVSIRGAKARSAALAEGVAGGGFLSQKKCDPSGRNCDIVTPGSWVQSQVNELIGPKKDLLAIIGADDIAAYLGAIVNAGINRLAKMGIDGLRGVLKKSTSDFTTVTPAAPCAGLTGEAFRSCIEFQRASQTAFTSGQYLVQNELTSTIEPRQQADSILNDLITNQTELVEALSSLSACRPSDISIQNQLAEEQETLDNLQNQLEDNLTFLEPLQQAHDSVNSAQTDSWGELGTQVINTQLLIDPETANNFFASVQDQQQTIQANIDAKLPGVKDQLQACSPSA